MRNVPKRSNPQKFIDDILEAPVDDTTWQDTNEQQEGGEPDHLDDHETTAFTKKLMSRKPAAFELWAQDHWEADNNMTGGERQRAKAAAFRAQDEAVQRQYRDKADAMGAVLRYNPERAFQYVFIALSSRPVI